MFLPFILLLLSTADASSNQEARDLFDRTYARDNTFCKLEQKTVEFQLRGNSRYTEPAEKATGQSAFYKNLKGQYVPLKLGSFQPAACMKAAWFEKRCFQGNFSYTS